MKSETFCPVEVSDFCRNWSGGAKGGDEATPETARQNSPSLWPANGLLLPNGPSLSLHRNEGKNDDSVRLCPANSLAPFLLRFY
jgi:hypothetical protein